MNVNLTIKSSNAKTGPIPVSTSCATSCPASCPFKKAGCYADSGPLSFLWRKVTEGKAGASWDAFCEKVAAMPEGQLWRHNQAGDLPQSGELIDQAMMDQLTEANKGKRGYTYTHHDMTKAHNRHAVYKANASGFTVNLSGNSPAHADELADLEIGPVVTVLPSDQMTNLTTPAGRKIVVCPAVLRDDVSCASCGLCQKVNRKVIVGFPAHGSNKRKASAIAAS